MPTSVPTTAKRPARYSMSWAAASSASPASAFAWSRVRSDATRTAEPPVKSEREPALPKPLPRDGVALDDADPVDRHAEDVDRELRVARRDALAHRLRRREDLDDPVGRDVDADLLLERVAAGPFEERGDAAAAQQAARLRLRAARGEAVPVGEGEALVEDLLERAAVVGLAELVLVRHLLGPDHVAATQLGGIELHLARRRVEQPLDDVDRLRPARAAVGAGRRRVRQHRLEVLVDDADVVDAGRDPRADQQLDRDARRRRIGADVGERAHAQRQRLAVAVERELGVAADVAPGRARQELLAAIGLPVHRPAERARRMGDDDVFRVHAGLHAEAAADVADEDVNLLLLDVRQCAGETCRDRGRHLVADSNRQPPRCRVERGDGAARLHRHRRNALVDEVELDADGGARERGRRLLGIAVAHLGGDVVGSVGRERGRAGRGRGGDVGDGGQLLVLDDHAVDRIARGLARFGDDGDDRLADVARHFVSERAARRRHASCGRRHAGSRASSASA